MPSQHSWTDVAPNSCVIVPVGSFEQHGPHLPLDTDTQIAIHLSEAVAHLQPAVIVAPAISISASGEHAGFPGTISIGTSALSTVFIEVVRSCDWAQGVIFVHGHGGNLEATHIASQTLRHENRNYAHWWPQIENSDAHAGITETSLMLAINPQVVHIDRLASGNTQPIAEIQHELRDRGVKSVSPNGILGDAQQATRDHGNLMLQRLVSDLDDFVNATRARWPRS